MREPDEPTPREDGAGPAPRAPAAATPPTEPSAPTAPDAPSSTTLAVPAAGTLRGPAPSSAPSSATSSALPPPSPVTQALLAMLDGVGDFGLVELERLLASLLLGAPPTPAEQRVAELSALAELLESELAVSLPHHPTAQKQVSQVDYDATRPPGAPTSETLVKRYGTVEKDGWSWVCRAAWGLLPDGRKTKPGMGWPAAARGTKRTPRSNRDVVIRSIRACAFELLRRPSSNVYIEWLDAHRRRANAGAGGGQTPRPQRPASIAMVYHQFPRGWATALKAADVTDEELAAARAKLVAARTRADASAPTARERLAEVDTEQLVVLGLDERARDRLLRNGFGQLPLSQAAALANALGGSLAWLAGHDEWPGERADQAMRFDPDALRAAAKRSGLKLEWLRAKAKLDVSGWRAVMTGKREPTLAHGACQAR